MGSIYPNKFKHFSDSADMQVFEALLYYDRG